MWKRRAVIDVWASGYEDTYRRYNSKLRQRSVFRDGGDKVREKKRREFQRLAAFDPIGRDNVLKHVLVVDRRATIAG